MKDARREYEAALADFSRPGARWTEKGRLTYWGKAAGLSAEDIVADARAHGVTDRDADIRRGWNDAKPRGDRPATADRSRSRSSPSRPSPADRRRRDERGGLVRTIIENGRDVDDMEKLAALSPVPICADGDPMARLVEAQHLLLLLFGRDEFAFVRSGKAAAVKATPGENLRTVDDWLGEPVGRDFGEVVGVNPLTGRQGRTTDGRPSYCCLPTVADFRHMVFEFDKLPLADQCRFWAGVIQAEALPLRALVYSGGKSIHGVVRVNAKSAEEYRRYAEAAAAKYANPADPPEMRLDDQALKNPLTGVRLAGAVRKDTGKRQALLYAARDRHDRKYRLALNPEAANGNGETTGKAEAATSADRTSAANGETTTPGEPPARRCEGCAALADCRQAFGRFWGEKSRGGIGCDSSFRGWGAARRTVEDMKRGIALDRLKRKR